MLKLNPIDFSKKYKYGIYLHINKTAGTSQRKIIEKYSDRIKIFDVLDIDKASELYNNSTKMKDCFVWTSVRNPYDRFISSVKGWKEKRVHKYIAEDYITVNYMLDIARIGHEIEWKIPWASSRQWYNMKKNYTEQYATTDFDMLDHIKPMYKIYQNLQIFNIPLHFIVRYEDLQQDWKVVCDMLDIEERELPHHNRSFCDTNGVEYEEFKNKTQKPFQEYYTEIEHRTSIEQIYAEDFKMFGYDTKFPERVKHPLEILIYIFNKYFNRSPNDEELAQYLCWIPDIIPLLEEELLILKQFEDQEKQEPEIEE